MFHGRPGPPESYIAQWADFVSVGAIQHAILAAWYRSTVQTRASFASPPWEASNLWPCDWCACATDVLTPAGCFCSERCEKLAGEAAAAATALPTPAAVSAFLNCVDGADMRPEAVAEFRRLAAAVAAEQRLAKARPGLLEGVRAVLVAAPSPDGARAWLWSGRAEWQGRSALEMLELDAGAEEVLARVAEIVEGNGVV